MRIFVVLLLWICLLMARKTVLEEMQGVCGRNDFDNRHVIMAKRIVGGVESRRGEWPWLVSIYLKRKSDRATVNKRAMFEMTNEEYNRRINEDESFRDEADALLNMMNNPTKSGEDTPNELEEHICGGTLISDQWVLSAKHCFRKDVNENLSTNPEDYLVILGEHEIRQQDHHEDIRKISKIIISKSLLVMRDDIALIKLAEPVKFNKFIRPACVPNKTDELKWGENCMVAGWGHEKTQGVVQEVPRHVAVPIIDFNECINRLWLPLYISGGYLDDRMFCAGVEGKDSCQFDSGGPLMCLNDEHNRYQVKGIVSFGYLCGSKYPGVYTNVQTFYDWINDIIEKDRNSNDE